MSLYYPPVLHNGSLNSVVNSTDFTTNNSTSSLNVSTADSRYLKLTGGSLTGNLTLPSEYDTGNLTAPSLTFSGNTVSQTAGQLGYVSSVSGSSVSFSNNTLISPGGITSLPIGVYILTVQIIISNNDTSNNMVISKLSYGCSTIGSTTTPNNYLYEITNESITIPVSSNNSYGRTYIYQNATQGSLNFLFNCSFTTSTSVSLNYYLSAMRIG